MLYFAWATCLSYSVGSSVPGYLATFTTLELEKSISFGSIASSIYSVGSVCCGYLLGRINDKFGVKSRYDMGIILYDSRYGRTDAFYPK